jgi:hypothetical protein
MLAGTHAIGRGRRVHVAIALATALLVLGGGVLTRRHEAEVGHARDTRTGVTTHAFATECHDQAPATHLHGAPRPHDDLDICSIVAALQQPTRIADPAVVTILRVIERAVREPRVARVAQSPLLLSAPKTSPPVRS